MRGLKGKNVVVTGGASGIGQATAARFLEEGSNVCVFDRDPDALARVQQELPGLSDAIKADVSNPDDVQAAFAKSVDCMGSVDVLINNAGISIQHGFLEITLEEWDRVLDVNLRGVFYVAQTAARHMVERGSGVIVNTGSTAATTGYPHYADYSASKGGVVGLTLAMALELAPTMLVLSPGRRWRLTVARRPANNGLKKREEQC
jgi:meso-butanediol dehydrogenase/(S,S)-butanediol dehydrogenase/diacetyl reductase